MGWDSLVLEAVNCLAPRLPQLFRSDLPFLATEPDGDALVALFRQRARDAGGAWSRAALFFLIHHHPQLPPAGVVTPASGPQAVLGWAKAASITGMPVTVLIPRACPRDISTHATVLGARCQVIEAVDGGWTPAPGQIDHHRGSALVPDPGDVALRAGAATLVMECHSRAPDIDVLVVPDDHPDILAGIVWGAEHYGIDVIAAAPTGRTHAPTTTGRHAPRGDRSPAFATPAPSDSAVTVGVTTADVDTTFASIRRVLGWSPGQLGATALAAVLAPASSAESGHRWRVQKGTTVAVVLPDADPPPPHARIEWQPAAAGRPPRAIETTRVTPLR